MCSQASDCGRCALFADLVDQVTDGDGPSRLVWACFRCLGTPFLDRRVEGQVLGYYDSGACGSCGRESIILNAVIVGQCLPEDDST
jgi:hypothetical protein